MIKDIAFVAKVVQGEVVFPVIMEDEPLHTEANRYRCTDHTCPCYGEDDFSALEVWRLLAWLLSLQELLNVKAAEEQRGTE